MTHFQGTHTHALTNVAHRYEGAYEAVADGGLRWQARVEHAGTPLVLTGEVRPQPPAGAPLQTVLAALHRRIDALG